jgi:hypothetical protein
VIATPAGAGVSRIAVIVQMSPVHAEFVRRKLLKIISVLSASLQLAASEADTGVAFDRQSAHTIDRAMWPAVQLSRKPANLQVGAASD